MAFAVGHDERCPEPAVGARSAWFDQILTLIGDFATIHDALAAGAHRFGLEPFLVRQAGIMEETVSIPALTVSFIAR